LDADRRAVSSEKNGKGRVQEFSGNCQGQATKPRKLTPRPTGGRGGGSRYSRSQLVTFKRGLNTRHRPHSVHGSTGRRCWRTSLGPCSLVGASIQALRTLVVPAAPPRSPRLRRKCTSASIGGSAGCRTRCGVAGRNPVLSKVRMVGEAVHLHGGDQPASCCGLPRKPDMLNDQALPTG